MSVFEIGMLVCFGASWPFSVYKTWTTKSCKGKSLIFLWFVLAGYAFGIVHKWLWSRDAVIFFYLVNGAMVLADLILSTLYYHRDKRLAPVRSGCQP
jgi:hypothetical protein